MSKEAMKLALEALEAARGALAYVAVGNAETNPNLARSTCRQGIHAIDKVEPAIREALAEHTEQQQARIAQLEAELMRMQGRELKLQFALAEQPAIKQDLTTEQPAQQQEPSLAAAWQQGYDQGVADERTSEANIGIAGFDAKVNPARNNPYSAEQQEPVACIIGTKGSAFDLPTAKRAYTYAEQPGNVVAYKIGRACEAAMKQSAGDGIDRGLAMLQELQKEGIGVFDLGAEYAAHNIK